MSEIIEKAKSFFHSQMLDDHKDSPYGLVSNHVLLVEKEMKECLKQFPEANEEIALLAVRLHDVGYYPLSKEVDHAVRGEERAKIFLGKVGVDPTIIDQVCHCVRAHRNADVKPKTLEAKLLIFSDSASHLVDGMYIHLLHVRGSDFVLGKIERDFKDLSLFEEMQEKYKSLYEHWKWFIIELQKFYP